MAAEINGDVIESMVRELGLKFVRRRDTKQDIEELSWRDPGTVHLCDPEDTSSFGGDALICYKKRNHMMRWGETSKAAIRKFLTEDGEASECGVCFEDVGLREAVCCAQCNSKICPVCMVKMCLTEETTRQILQGFPMAGHQCPECRNQCSYDFKMVYYQVYDRLDEFTTNQQEAIRFTMLKDDFRDIHMSYWVQMHPLKYFKKGAVVKLRFLKKQKKWNGQKAKINGEYMIKGDILRWPVQLIGKYKAKALLRQNNMVCPLSRNLVTTLVMEQP